MVTFRRTHDLDLVRSVMAHPEVWASLTDDLSCALEDFRPSDHSAIWYVLAYAGERLLGLWAFHPQNSVCWEAHTCLFPNAGRDGIEAGKALPGWMWEHSTCRRITVSVPVHNRRARIFALAVGLRKFGCNPASFLKDGRLESQRLYAIDKPEVPSCPLQ